MSPKSGRPVYKLAGGALRRLGAVGEDDLQGNSPMDTGFVLQVKVYRDSCAAWCHVSLTQLSSSRKLQRTQRVRECTVATTMSNFHGCNPAVISNFSFIRKFEYLFVETKNELLLTS
jgi:hypothetical protein